MPLRALLRKEFRLQHINLLLAAGLLLLHGAAVLIRRLNADYFVVHRSEAMILESVPLLWMAMPLLVGCVAIAEERKLGTLEGFLCLPTNRRLQFVMKLVLALSLGIFFGGVTPLLVEWLGNFLAASSHPSGLAIEGEVMSVVTTLLFGSAGITLLSLYASTLTHNTLQALG